MPKIPSQVWWDHSPLMRMGLKHIHTGKVRETYEIPGHPDLLLVITTDRLSIFDFVLNTLVPDKGAVLTALTAFWVKTLESVMPHAIVAYGNKVNDYLSQPLPPELLTRAIIMRRIRILPHEFIARGYLTGSALKPYLAGQPVCGHVLPPGYHDGSQLLPALCTPTTKADSGHDEAVDVKIVRPDARLATLALYQEAASIARRAGIIIADTKFEFGLDSDDRLTLGDEILTPDSSRFWLLVDWLSAQKKKKSPLGLDKQPVRDFGKTRGIDQFNPESDADLATVTDIRIPEEVVAATTNRYRYILWLLTGEKLESFQRRYGIEVSEPRLQIDVVFGSENDVLGQKGVLEIYAKAHPETDLHIHVLSCHRNPDQLRNFASGYPKGPNQVLVAGAGKAAALPGVLKAWMSFFGNPTPVVGVGLPGTTMDASMAATLSIEELPGQPVELNSDGRAFASLIEALNRARGEFLTRTVESKPAKLNVDWRSMQGPRIPTAV
ncbi:MAG: phosphoribosylaminoimidazolesuccinocarboxamide synthase [Patescibacteria group bacterium]|nr:phosphoribosylaminoimidazolesuccinocarboxamide synthase [Patescibacteria group bacterium]MDD5120977.1 phosphoribosylaminoimidazolesuccinocarboxamide synthase [Patescibacteria group bacterium]MDD5396420.1 phosphoribosylaminoimidazolesuccinocarboxamide synthase [Patescibacteria group bacterium]